MWKSKVGEHWISSLAWTSALIQDGIGPMCIIIMLLTTTNFEF